MKIAITGSLVLCLALALVNCSRDEAPTSPDRHQIGAWQATLSEAETAPAGKLWKGGDRPDTCGGCDIELDSDYFDVDFVWWQATEYDGNCDPDSTGGCRQTFPCDFWGIAEVTNLTDKDLVLSICGLDEPNDLNGDRDLPPRTTVEVKVKASLDCGRTLRFEVLVGNLVEWAEIICTECDSCPS